MNKLTKIFKDVYAEQDIQLRPELHIRELENWNSFNHISMMINLETTYGVIFSSGDIEKINTVGDLLSILKEKGITNP